MLESTLQKRRNGVRRLTEIAARLAIDASIPDLELVWEHEGTTEPGHLYLTLEGAQARATFSWEQIADSRWALRPDVKALLERAIAELQEQLASA